jgi:hypothetical protein
MSSPATDVWNERIAFLEEHGLPTLKGICNTFVQTAASLICGEDDVFECFGEDVESFEQVLDFLRDDPTKLKVVLEAVEKVDVFNRVQDKEYVDSTFNQLKAAIALHYLVHGKDCRAAPVEGAEEQPAAKKAKTESETPEATPEEVAKESAGNETPEKLADEETPTLA